MASSIDDVGLWLVAAGAEVEGDFAWPWREKPEVDSSDSPAADAVVVEANVDALTLGLGLALGPVDGEERITAQSSSSHRQFAVLLTCAFGSDLVGEGRTMEALEGRG